MEKFREILRLRALGYNQCQIARSYTITRLTVPDYVRRASAKGFSYDDLSLLTDAAARALLGKGQHQPRQVQEAIDFESIQREFNRKGVTLALLWQEAWTRDSGMAAMAASVGAIGVGKVVRACRCTRSTRLGRNCLWIIAV